MTNYEKIKSMSIDEMAQALNDKIHGCLLVIGCMCNCGVNISEDCAASITKWLKSEVEENA